MTPWTRRLIIIAIVVIAVAAMYFGYFDELLDTTVKVTKS